MSVISRPKPKHRAGEGLDREWVRAKNVHLHGLTRVTQHNLIDRRLLTPVPESCLTRDSFSILNTRVIAFFASKDFGLMLIAGGVGGGDSKRPGMFVVAS